jgi:hypothetical protein
MEEAFGNTPPTPPQAGGKNMDHALRILESLRLGVLPNEYVVQGEIAREFEKWGVKFLREYKLGGGSRVDFLLDDGTAVEVKNGKPNSGRLAAQVERYCGFPMVTGLIVVVATSVFDVPEVAHGKRVAYVALNRNWGVAI